MSAVQTSREPKSIMTSVRATNFRSLEHMELELSPLTVLVGPNASGKSNIVDVLRFVADGLRNYHIFPNVFREPQKPGRPYPLGEHGENLASVLRDMIKEDGRFLPDLRYALGKVVPGVCDLAVSQVGGYLVVKLKHTVQGGNGRGAWFDLSQESDGTLRLLGLLVALFQDPVPSLIAIEEPELTIHPGALAVLADLVNEATRRTQVLITTHSPDLIDHVPVESLRAVEAVGGITNVGPGALQQLEAVKKGLFSPAELHRMEGLERAKTSG